MRLTRRDALATLFVGGAAVVYALWATGAALPGLSARPVGWIVFGLGWAACTSNQSEMAVVYGVGSAQRASMAYVVVASIIGAAALVCGVITLVSGNGAMLAALVATTTTLWAMATIRHAMATQPREERHTTRLPLGRAA